MFLFVRNELLINFQQIPVTLWFWFVDKTRFFTVCRGFVTTTLPTTLCSYHCCHPIHYLGGQRGRESGLNCHNSKFCPKIIFDESDEWQFPTPGWPWSPASPSPPATSYLSSSFANSPGRFKINHMKSRQNEQGVFRATKKSKRFMSFLQGDCSLEPGSGEDRSQRGNRCRRPLWMLLWAHNQWVPLQ